MYFSVKGTILPGWGWVCDDLCLQFMCYGDKLQDKSFDSDISF